MSKALRHASRLALTAATILATSCADGPLGPTAASMPMSLRVTSALGSVPDSLSLTIRNAGVRPLSFSGCPGVPAFEFQRQQGATWQTLGTTNIICVAIYYTISVTLQPGDSLVRTFAASDTGNVRLMVSVADAVSNTPVQLPSPAVVVR